MLANTETWPTPMCADCAEKAVPGLLSGAWSGPVRRRARGGEAFPKTDEAPSQAPRRDGERRRG